MIRRLLPPFAACALAAGAAPVLLDPADRARFPEALFPGIGALTTEQLVDAGLRARYPERIRDTDPAAAPDGLPAVRSDELAGGHAFVRTHDVAAALDPIAAAVAQRSAVLDLRHARGDVAAATALGNLLALSAGAGIDVVGNVDGGSVAFAPDGRRAAQGVVVVLVGPGTRGPLEAALAALAERREVVLVGGRTAGDTGVFARVAPEGPFVLAGEVVPRGLPSLLGAGVAPLVAVPVPEAEAQAVARALDSGAALGDVVDAGVEKPRFDEAALIRGDAPQVGDGDAAPRRAPEDRVLQRALAILGALEALGRIAPAPAPSAPAG